MAVIDYGAIAFKNGKLISTGMFTDMKDTVGFSDKELPLLGREGQESIGGNCFVTVGDERIIIGFFKCTMLWWVKTAVKDDPNHGYAYRENVEMFGYSPYVKWGRWENQLCIESHWGKRAGWVKMVVKPKNGYYVAKITVYEAFPLSGKNVSARYKVYFGYGVDYDFYKKTRRVNYYRSPEHLIRELPSYIKWQLFYPLKHKVKVFCENVKRRKRGE